MRTNGNKHSFLFDRTNYILLLVGIFLNIIGFLIMIGGASKDPNVFDANELFSPIRLTIAPILILLGYVVIFYTIMKRPKSVSHKKPE
ncbi:MAG: DUF3098 domain-containing protein [Brumimicrobium sp.]|nr:DUF3098 domain-containing protein [Brumimicrobium sp.]MCO5268119.1 DUF3098 domain-containing protein [Brumimicrobium sp.]